MRNQYTVLSDASSKKLPPRKTRVYPDSLDCEHCGKSFKPTKDRKRFCCQQCHRDWEKKRALDAKPFGKPTSRKVKERSVEAVKKAVAVNDEFAERCEYWLAQYREEVRKSKKLSGKRDIRLPIILTGHGVSLKIESGALHVKDGFTHYPQERQEFRFFPCKHNTPSRIIILGSSGNVTLDSICWLSAQNIPLVVIDYRGNELASVCSSTGIEDYELRLAQLSATRPETALMIAKDLIKRKLLGCIDNLELFAESQLREYTRHKLSKHIDSIEAVQTTNDLLVLEATSALSYFKLWQDIDLKWTAKSQRAIPDDWFYMDKRQSKVSGINRYASHPVNAILNYAYAVLESQVRIACEMMGFDTSISYLHSMQFDRSSLIYDLMEPLRPLVERKLVGILVNNTFTKDDFQISIQGICKLCPHLMKLIACLNVPDLEVSRILTILRDTLIGSPNK